MKKIFIGGYKVIKALFGGHGLGTIYPISRIHHFVLKHLKSSSAVVLGHEMFLDSEDHMKLSVNGVYEEFETMLFSEKIKQGDVVLDIGANIGYFTLIFARLVGAEGRVYAFEPDPTNFTLLKKNVEANGYDNVVLIPKAVSNENGKLCLFLSENNVGDHRIYDSNDGRRHVSIESVRLDDFFKDYAGEIDFIKMDIQGAEGGAVQGMNELLKKNKNVILISEFWPVGLKRFGKEPLEYLKQLMDNGFQLFEIKEQRKKLEETTPEKLLSIYTLSKENYTNLFCTKD